MILTRTLSLVLAFCAVAVNAVAVPDPSPATADAIVIGAPEGDKSHSDALAAAFAASDDTRKDDAKGAKQFHCGSALSDKDAKHAEADFASKFSAYKGNTTTQRRGVINVNWHVREECYQMICRCSDVNVSTR
jgi:hypothetical protein